MSQNSSANLTPPTPQATTRLTPHTRREGHKIAVEVLMLNDIPKAMDHMCWETSAQLMRHWFATKPAYLMPEEIRSGDRVDYLALSPGQIEDSIVKMDWLLRFSRVKPVFNEITRIWNNPAGIDRLRKCLRRAGWEPGKTTRLGDGVRFAKELDMKAQLNARAFGAYTDTFGNYSGTTGSRLENASLRPVVVLQNSNAINLAYSGSTLLRIILNHLIFNRFISD